MNLSRTAFIAFVCLSLSLACDASEAPNYPEYRSETNLVYSTINGDQLTLNAFLPVSVAAPVPAIVEIHGGWWFGGEAARTPEGVGGWQIFMHRGLAIFSIEYRLGRAGGFPENLRDCRNAIRFLRKNASRFNIDPDRIAVTGGSAGGHLSLMVAMVPEDFPDGGPTPGLEGISARVSGSFSYIPPTDFVRFWHQGPDDVVTNRDGTISFRGPDDKIPYDSRPRLRILFHGIAPDTAGHQALYTSMCPIGQVRRDVPPLLICDGEKDPIVPGLHGKELYERLKAEGADVTYWMTPGGGHGFPGGAGFNQVLDGFIGRTLKLDVPVKQSCMQTEAQGVQFTRIFAPQAGLVSQYEQAARSDICLNGLWHFQGADTDNPSGDSLPQLAAWEDALIKIPSPWNVNSFVMDQSEQGGDFCAYPSYPKSWEHLPAAWMQKTVAIPADWWGRRVVLRFGAVAGNLVVYVNGRRAGEGFDIFFAQEFDVTDLIQFGADNEITVKVMSPKVFDRPGQYGRREYLSGSFWGTHIAGIWQDVDLLALPRVAVTGVFVQSWVNRDELRIQATVTNSSQEEATVDLSGSVHDWINLAGKSILEAPEVKWKLARHPALNLAGQPFTLAPGKAKTVMLSAKVDGCLKLWSPDTPNLYGLLLNVSANGKVVDVKYQRFGWRQFTLDRSRLCLNGQPIVLKGDSWHFMGVPQMTRRYAYAWYRLLKDAGANAVRLHASVYPSFYHDLADEMGIMILDESAIWLSDGGPKADSDLFWANCRAHVAELVQRDRNHPSVFGWSICNEALPVLRNVWHTPQDMLDHCLEQMTVWKNICLTNDPTRGWISGDGEWDADGRLPVISIHYGGVDDLRRAAASGKPWGVGETSMAYYGTPKQVSAFNGNRAYESDLGRMEGLAYECYGLLRDQRTFGADYESVFNLAWYSVQPLPLGKSDVSKPIAADEGIFFPKYREGIPGMQPERLGPYTSTLNPGYDPNLPLYRPWPMFNAIRDANLDQTNSRWAQCPLPVAAKSRVANPAATHTLAYLPGNGDGLVQTLARAGVKATPYTDAAEPDFLLLDGSLKPDDLQSPILKKTIDQVLAHGATLWVWNLSPAGATVLSQWFGREIQAVPRVASSFVVNPDAALLTGLDNASFYFSEADDWRQMAFGLDGKFLGDAQVLLAASPADWRKWSYQAEPVKTAALFRSEFENPAPRAAMVAFPYQSGHVILCNLSPEITSLRKALVIEQLFLNAGIETFPVASQNEFIDFGGRLVKALVCGSFGFSEPGEEYTRPLPAGKIQPGKIWEGRKWTLRPADKAGVFDFKRGLIAGPTENASAYLAVWIKSPKPLNDLLSEPNLPKLDFNYGSDDGCEVWLNGQLLATHEREGPLDPDMFSENPLLLQLGWNQLVVKVVQLGGDWKFSGRFNCSDTSFLPKLEFAAEPPNSP